MTRIAARSAIAGSSRRSRSTIRAAARTAPAVDSEGFYWCAVFANSCLLRFDPEGRLERRVPMPVKYPTMPAFGGDDLRTLFVTSANWPIP